MSERMVCYDHDCWHHRPDDPACDHMICTLAPYESWMREPAGTVGELRARIQRLERERDMHVSQVGYLDRIVARKNERIAELEQERDNLMGLALKHQTCMRTELLLEARIRQLEATLREAQPVLEYVSRGRGFVDVERYPDATARRVLGDVLSRTEDTPAYVTGDGRPRHCGPYCEHPGPTEH